MSPQVPPALAGKLGTLGPPSAEFAGTDWALNEAVKSLFFFPVVGAALIGLSIFLFYPLVVNQGLIILLGALAAYALYLLAAMFWLRWRPSRARAIILMILFGVALFLGSHEWRAQLAFALGAAGILFVLTGLGSMRFISLIHRNRRMRVLVYPEGIVVVHPDWTNAVRWDQVLRLRQGTRKLGRPEKRIVPTPNHYTLECRNGSRVDLERSFAAIQPAGDRSPGDSTGQQLGELVRRETLAALLPAARAEFDAGQKLHFDGLTIDKQGLHKGGELLPWGLVTNISVDEKGFLNIKARHRDWLSAPAWDFTNIHVLQALSDYARSYHSGAVDPERKRVSLITDELMKAIQSELPTGRLGETPYEIPLRDPPKSHGEG